MKTFGKVALTVVLCLVFPVVLVIDLFYGGTMTDGVAAALRRIWKRQAAD